MHIKPAAAVAALAMAGAGLGVALTAAASGSGAPKVQVDSVYCNGTGVPGHAAHGSCTFLLTDGRRFACPLSFSRHSQTPDSLEEARACRPLSPIRIPRSWQRVFTRLYAAKACLAHQGLRVVGGPALGQPPTSPIGELMVSSAFIAFYADVRAAERAEPHVLVAMRRVGGEATRRGSVTVAWTKPPSAALRTATQACGLP